MPTVLMPIVIRGCVACVMAGVAWSAGAQTLPPKATPDATLHSTPATVIWGYLSADLPPALTIKSGQTVKIDTVSHQGLMGQGGPGDVLCHSRHPEGSGAAGRHRHPQDGAAHERHERAR